MDGSVKSTNLEVEELGGSLYLSFKGETVLLLILEGEEYDS